MREASAQQFGGNKVEYVNFDFKILDTEHFAVYYYANEETSARLAARLAERWYARLSRVLGHSVRVLLDHRRYTMVAKPYTLATRIVHVGQYGSNVEDPRLQSAFFGGRQFVHGYGWSALACEPTAEGSCQALDQLLGNRLVAANLEIRFPVMGVRSREIRYGPVPMDGFLFIDAGLMWTRSSMNTF